MSAFSDEMARLMTASGIGVRALARMSGYSAGYLSRLRNGLQAPPDDTAARLDELLGADGALIAAARQHASKPPRPDMTAAWRAAPPAPPEPAGFPDGISPAEHLHRLRVVLMEQDNLLGPSHVAPVLLDQIRLIERLRQGCDGTDGRELLLLQAMYSEFAAWCAQDAADWRTAQYWLDRALELAHMTLDPVWPAYILARKAQLAGDMHDPVHAVGLARAAAATARNGYRARLSGVATSYQAQGMPWPATRRRACPRSIRPASRRTARMRTRRCRGRDGSARFTLRCTRPAAGPRSATTLRPPPSTPRRSRGYLTGCAVTAASTPPGWRSPRPPPATSTLPPLADSPP